MSKFFTLISLVLLSLLWVANAETIVGKCVGVTDGDTCAILYTENGKPATDKIRLNGIDAPESHQDFGQASKKALSDLIFGKQIKVEVAGRDKYRRMLGRIYVDGEDVNLKMVQLGMAWWYRQYASSDKVLEEAEQQAKEAKTGLWSQPNPTAPWDFRHKPKAKQSAQSSSAVSTTTATGSGDYWITSSSRKTHNSSCRYYEGSAGYHSSTGTGNNCKICGGDGVEPTQQSTTSVSFSQPKSNGQYWVTFSSGKTHNSSCRWYANSNGYYSSTGTGNNCKICGGAN